MKILNDWHRKKVSGRKGQVTLEWVSLILLFIVALSAIRFYATRRFQGYIRTGASQFSQDQYAGEGSWNYPDLTHGDVATLANVPVKYIVVPNYDIEDEEEEYEGED